jgi:hypothetical protein
MTRPCRRSAASPRGFLYTTCLTSSLSAEAAHTHSRESVLFIGTNSVPTTPQYICHPMPRDVHDVCVIVCNCVYLCSKVLGPFIPRTSLLMPFPKYQYFGVLISHHAVSLPLGAAPALTGPSAPPLRFLPLKPPNGFIIPPLLP